MRDFTLSDIENLLDRKLEEKLEQHYQNHKADRYSEMVEVFNEGLDFILTPMFEEIHRRLDKLEARLGFLERKLIGLGLIT